MCQYCASPWGACGCPKEDDSITRCGCESGVYCAVCGHYPKPPESQSLPQAPDQEAAGQESADDDQAAGKKE